MTTATQLLATGGLHPSRRLFRSRRRARHAFAAARAKLHRREVQLSARCSRTSTSHVRCQVTAITSQAVWSGTATVSTHVGSTRISSHLTLHKQTVYVASEVCMQHHSRPARFFIACGDGNFYASNLTYSTYGGRVAQAHGVLTQNTCTPACFDGSYVSEPGTIQLSHIATCEGRLYYDEISWRFLEPSPFPANNTGRQNISPAACPPY